MVKMRREDLDNRFVDFSVAIMKLTKKLPKDSVGLYLKDQLSRSSISATLNYGESESAESRRDFVHKLRVSLKELRETMIGLKIIRRSELHLDPSDQQMCLDECNELISILVKSINTVEGRK